MKVITSIYLNCRPDLRDEWLSGTEVEDVTEALVSISLTMGPSFCSQSFTLDARTRIEDAGQIL